MLMSIPRGRSPTTPQQEIGNLILSINQKYRCVINVRGSNTNNLKLDFKFNKKNSKKLLFLSYKFSMQLKK